MLHTITAHQIIKSDIQTVWEFMSDPRNLAKITPVQMRFQILNKEEVKPMYQGQLIEYYVRPLLGVRLHWVTEITHVAAGNYFVDEQRYGPYSFWHHQHFFEETDAGIAMTDLVHYKLPLGPLGKLANMAFVQNQLREIFDYRFQQVERIFNQPAHG